MKPLSILVALTVLLTAIPAFAQEFRVGTVDMRKLLFSFHETKSMDAEVKVERDLIRKKDEERMTAVKALGEELKKLQAEFNDPSLAAERRKKVASQFEEKQENFKMLNREREEFIQRSDRAMREKNGAKLFDIRKKIAAAVQAYAATQEVDYVFDAAGLTTGQTPFLLYVREPIDLTEGVLKELNKDAPAPPEKPEEKTEAKK